ncbi:MAG TPA: tripartite tricarboxylate transporter substrate binding protein [Burkholderiales bacterium]|nr:tripartite tricarboxylate transporter substrate binding protein [Burkholderiales bacterium]
MIIALLRDLVAVLCAFAAQAAFAAESPATAYPVRPIRLIVPTAPGGGTDNVARTYAPRLSQLLGQQIVVDNRGGAGGSIGATLASRAPSDGYTLLATFATHATNPAVLKDTQYDLIRDFQPITLTVVLPNLLVVNPAVGVKDVKSLIALARSQPGKVQFASGSFGASSHLSMELLLGMTGTRMLNVPYKGVGPALTAVVAGEVQVMIGSLLSALPQVRNARLTALGVTSAKRAGAAPDIPTIAEAGVPGYQADNWSGLLAPAGTPRGVVMKLYTATVKVLQEPALNQRFVTEGGEPAPSRSPEAFGEMIKTEVQKWSKVAREDDIQPQ